MMLLVYHTVYIIILTLYIYYVLGVSDTVLYNDYCQVILIVSIVKVYVCDMHQYIVCLLNYLSMFLAFCCSIKGHK